MPPEQTPNLGGDCLDRSDACRKLGEVEVAQVGTSEERAAVLSEGVAIPLEGWGLRLQIRERVDAPLAPLPGSRRPDDQRL